MNVEDRLGFPLDQLEGRLILGDPKAHAYMWISRYADNLTARIEESNRGGYEDYHLDGVSVHDLLSCADSHQSGGWGDYITRGGVFEGEAIDDTFWDKYAILCDKPRDEITDNSFFSCSC